MAPTRNPMIIASPLLLTSLLAVSVAAQQPNAVVGGAPTMGYVFDRADHSLRPIWGVPGAATLGPSLDLGFSVKDASIANEQGYALASDGSAVRLIRWVGGISVADIPVVGNAVALFMSPRGTAAGVLTDSPSGTWLGIVTGLSEGSPRVAGIPLNSQPAAAAVSDDGAYILTAQQDGTAVVIGQDGTRTLLSAPAPISKVAFRPGSTDALAASPDHRVWWIQQTLSSAVFTVLATGVDPVGLGFLPDGTHAVIATARPSVVRTLDVATGAGSSVLCSCDPVQLERMAIPGVFRLTEATGEPQYLVNAATGETFFVPAARANERRVR